MGPGEVWDSCTAASTTEQVLSASSTGLCYFSQITAKCSQRVSHPKKLGSKTQLTWLYNFRDQIGVVCAYQAKSQSL